MFMYVKLHNCRRGEGGRFIYKHFTHECYVMFWLNEDVVNNTAAAILVIEKLASRQLGLISTVCDLRA